MNRNDLNLLVIFEALMFDVLSLSTDFVSLRR